MGIKEKLDKVVLLNRNKEFQQAIEICEKILAKKPKLFNARQLLALNYHGMEQFDEAIEEFEKAILLNDHHAPVYNNLGNVYKDTQQLVKAEQAYFKALSINPNYSDALNNLGNLLQKTRNYSDAEVNYRKAIVIDGSNASYKVNLGEALAEQGKFDDAIESYVSALTQDNTQSQAYFLLFNTFMYLHRYQDALETADLGIASQQLSDMQLCELLVGKAMIFWLFDNPEEAELAITLSDSVHLCHTSYANIDNLRIFHSYISKLVEFRKKNPSFYETKKTQLIYFISESHGFGPNGASIKYQQQDYSVRSLLITGAKIFHLIQEQPNKYQASLLTFLQGVPTNSKVVLGFGEIDCRSTEGIFKYCLNSNKDFHLVIENILDQYVGALIPLASELGHEIILYGVPAPHSRFVDKLEPAQQEQFKQLIAYFNQYLAKLCLDSNIKLLDVYQLTNLNGISNQKYNIDAIHMKPETVPELFEKLI